MKSEATLVASKAARWGGQAGEALRAILSRIAAEERAASVYEVRTAIGEQTKTFREAADLFGCTAPFGAVAGQGSLVMHVHKIRIWALTDWLKARGATTITIGELTYVLDGSTEAFQPVYDALGIG